MPGRGRQESTRTIYTEEQIKRSIVGSGFDIENEVDSDFIIFCPFHANYRSPAGEVSKESGMFWCFSCHTSKSLVELIMFGTKKTFFEATRFIDSKATQSDIVDIVDRAMETKPEFVAFDELLIKRLNRQALESQRALEYFRLRRVTEQSIRHYMLGYSARQDMITIPVTSPAGMFVGFVGRSIEGKEFKNTPNLPRSKTLFNLSNNRMADHVFVVESALDAIRLEQAGGNAVATLGSTVSKTQLDLLRKYFSSATVIGDNDEAGHRMIDKTVERLGSMVIPAFPPLGLKDIGGLDDLALKEFVQGLDNPLSAML